MPKKKAGIVRVPSDDLASQADGWVEMYEHLRAKHLPYLASLDAETLIDAASTGSEKAEAMQRTIDFLAVFITDWNWKDSEGNAYPKPADNPDAFGELWPKEYRWLNVRLRDRIVEDTDVPKANGEPS